MYLFILFIFICTTQYTMHISNKWHNTHCVNPASGC